MDRNTVERKAASHDDPGFRTPAAWAQMKQAFGKDIAEQCIRLERCAMACPRILLAAAIYHFLTEPEDSKTEIILAYLESLRLPSEELTLEELQELNELEMQINSCEGRRIKRSPEASPD